MDMKDRLPSILVAVDDCAVTLLLNPFRFSHFFSRQKEFTDQYSILRFEIIEGRDMALGDDQDMRALVD
jgi:hypothetical protein